MSDEQTQLMEKYGITSETKTIFHFQSHKYDRFADALSYAQKTTPDSESPKEKGLDE